MKTRVAKFAPNGFYCLTGNASANSLFFENELDQQLFMKLLERFLGELITLYAYSTNPTGWSLYFTVKEKATVENAYRKLKSKSKKVKNIDLLPKPEVMIAEHFRYFLSAYVKQSNFRHQRHGSRVHSRMEKYVFATLENMEADLAEMRNMTETNVQKPKYRPNMEYYLVEKQLKRDSVWRHSFVGIDGEKLVQAVVPCFRWIFDQIDVLRQLILNTWNFHFGPNNNPNPPPLIE